MANLPQGHPLCARSPLSQDRFQQKSWAGGRERMADLLWPGVPSFDSWGDFCACIVSPLPYRGDICDLLIFHSRFPSGSVVKNLPANAGDTGSIPGSGRSPRRRNGNSFQYSCLENPMDRRARWAGYSPYDCRMGNDWTHTHHLLLK